MKNNINEQNYIEIFRINAIKHPELYDQAELKKAITKYEKRPRAGNRSFEHLLELFRTETNFTAIGNQLGLTRERVRQIYKEFFHTLFPGLTCGHARHKAATARKRQAHIDALKLPDEISQKLETEKLFWKFTSRRPRFGQIGRFRCHYSIIKNENPTRPDVNIKYGRVTFPESTLHMADYLIVLIDRPRKKKRFFVIPSYAVWKNYAKGERNLFQIHIPLTKKLTTYMKPRVDMLKFEDAWHQLKR